MAQPAIPKAMVDLILAVHPDSMNENERVRLVSMTAAYAGVRFTELRVVSVTPANSCRVRLEMPIFAVETLIAGFQARDPRLFAFLEEFGGEAGLLLVEAAAAEDTTAAFRTDTSEKGLESQIVAGMLGIGWIAGQPGDYDRDYSVDIVQLTRFLKATQEAIANDLQLDTDNPVRRQFLARLDKELAARGVIDVLRRGSSTENTTRSFSTPARPRATKNRKRSSGKTASVSRGSCGTAEMKPAARWTYACLSTDWLSPPSS